MIGICIQRNKQVYYPNQLQAESACGYAALEAKKKTVAVLLTSGMVESRHCR